MDDTVKQIFVESFEQSINTYGETERSVVAAFILNLCGRIRAYVIATKPGIELFSEQVFTTDTERDFILTLMFNFSTRLALSNINTKFNDIINALAFSLSPFNEEASNGRNKSSAECMIPSEILDRMESESDIRSNLQNNKWMVIVLLIKLYIDLEDFKQASA